MRSAPFRRFAVVNSLGWLLFLWKINCCSSQELLERKIFRKPFRRASKCVCAINVFGSHLQSAVLSQIQPCPFVCPQSSSFVFTCNAPLPFWQEVSDSSENTSPCIRLCSVKFHHIVRVYLRSVNFFRGVAQ